jgi:pimeloyl-ACP methyl ester carboxylesterase
VPGGGSSVHGYFTELEQSLGSSARLIKTDPRGLDPEAGVRWLTLSDHARWLAQAVRRDGPGPVVVIGHSLGGLVALRLALDDPDIVGGLLLLDPSPPIFAALLPAPLLKVIGSLRKAVTTARLAWRRGPEAPLPAPSSLPLSARLLRYVVLGGVALAADTAAGGIPKTPAIVVSTAEHQPRSAARRAQERLTAWIPGARLEVWPNTTHAIHPEQPGKTAEAALSLLRAIVPDRRADLPISPGPLGGLRGRSAQQESQQ